MNLNSIEWMTACVLNGLLPIHEAAERIRVTARCVRAGMDLGEPEITVRRPRGPRTPESVKRYIRKTYPNTQAADIAKVLGMPVGNVRLIANRLGLKKDAAELTRIRLSRHKEVA